MPFVAAERRRLTENLGRRAFFGGGPCAASFCFEGEGVLLRPLGPRRPVLAVLRRRGQRRWAGGGAGGGGGGGAGGRVNAGESPVDLELLIADPPGGDADAWANPATLLGGAAACFRRAALVHANLTAAEQHYIGGWSNVGPNNLFRAVLLHPSGRVP